MQKLRNERSFGQNLRRLRMAAGLTQEGMIAELQLQGCEISRSVYSQMECGKYNIRIRELAAMHKVLGVSYDAFFEGLYE